MKHLKIIPLSLFLVFSSLLGAFMSPTVASAVSCDQRFLSLPPWYRGLTDRSADCNIVVPDEKAGGIQSFIQILALNIVEIIMQIVAYVSVAFIIVGGFKYMVSTGSPDANSKGRQTIQNALIGLVISIVAIGVVNFVVRIGSVV